jgi:hypothetical protein
MKLVKNCECCGKIFEYNPSRRPKARFCSESCLSRLTKKEQDQKRSAFLKEETFEQSVNVMRNKFERFVIKGDGCWGWSRCKHSTGYGEMFHRGKHWKAHRASWTIHFGEIPKGLFVCHKCDNRICSNPEHLFLGTNAENMKDMASKKRAVPRATLTKEQVLEIKKMIKLGVSSTKIGRDYNVSDVCIHYIKHNKTWKDIV